MEVEQRRSRAELSLAAETLPSRQPIGLARGAQIVQLGNKGLQWEGEEDFAETRRLALAHPEWEIIGIDCAEPPKNSADIENWRQIRGDFKAGLDQLDDGSITRINAVYCMGYYDRGGEQLIFEGSEFDATPERFPELVDYTIEVLNLCRAKLAPRGCLSVVVGGKAAEIVRAALRASSFQECAGRESPLGTDPRRSTFWIKFFAESNRPAVRFRLRNQLGELKLLPGTQDAPEEPARTSNS